MKKGELWTPENRARLIAMVNVLDPPQNADVAPVFGCSENAIAGIVHRLNKQGLLPNRVCLPKAPFARKLAKQHLAQAQPKPPKPVPSKAPTVAKAPQRPPAPAMASSATIARSREASESTGTCVWPMWGKEMPLDPVNPQMCGKPRRKGHRNYCEGHADAAVERRRSCRAA